LPSAINPIIEYAVKANKSAADSKHVSIEIEMAQNSSTIVADSEKSAWVLTNLISNALRYSYENAVIHIKTEQVNNQVRFSVSDTGQGIQPQYLKKIFERYFRIPGTKKEGTGLGLSISKEFIEAQGGEIWVESEFGVGSTFYFTLNMERKNT